MPLYQYNDPIMFQVTFTYFALVVVNLEVQSQNVSDKSQNFTAVSEMIMPVDTDIASISPPHIRTPDNLFNSSTLLYGSTVSCASSRPRNDSFPAETWSCYNIKVDTLRIRYWYIPGFGAETACSDGKMSYDSRNDIYALCRELMKAHGIKRELWTAYVNDASCSNSKQARKIFVIKDGVYQWETFEAGRGFIKTLRCMSMDG